MSDLRLTNEYQESYIMQIKENGDLIDRSGKKTIDETLKDMDWYTLEQATIAYDEHLEGCDLAHIEPTKGLTHFYEKEKLKLEGELVQLTEEEVLKAAMDGYGYPFNFNWVYDNDERFFEERTQNYELHEGL